MEESSIFASLYLKIFNHEEILLLGSGELGKEFVISAQRKGQHIIACDSYAGAPAMQVADECEVFDMLNGEELERIVKKVSARTLSSPRLKPFVRNVYTISKKKGFR